MTMPGSATRRMLQRSIIQPNTGTIRALKMPPKDRAKEAVPRCQPISSISGFRNTPKVKAMTGPLQTTSPVTAPATTHQGLVNLIPTVPPLFAFRLAPDCHDDSATPLAARYCNERCNPKQNRGREAAVERDAVEGAGQ